MLGSVSALSMIAIIVLFTCLLLIKKKLCTRTERPLPAVEIEHKQPTALNPAEQDFPKSVGSICEETDVRVKSPKSCAKTSTNIPLKYVVDKKADRDGLPFQNEPDVPLLALMDTVRPVPLHVESKINKRPNLHKFCQVADGSKIKNFCTFYKTTSAYIKVFSKLDKLYT